MAAHYDTARRSNLAFKAPNNQTWTPGAPIIFSSSPRTQHHPSQPRTSRKASSQIRRIHTSSEFSDDRRVDMYTPKKSSPGYSSVSSTRDLDIMEAEAFQPLYRSTKSYPSLSESLSSLSNKRKANGDLKGLPQLEDEDSDASYMSEATDPLESDVEEGEVMSKEPEMELEEEPQEVPVEEPEEDPLFPVTHLVDEPTLLKSMKVSSHHPDSYWRFTLYADSKGRKPSVHYCTTISSINRVFGEHFQNERVIGFDLEWNPSCFSGSPWWEQVSVMQLASQSHIAIFHLSEAVKRELETRQKDPLLKYDDDDLAVHKKSHVYPDEVLFDQLVTFLADPSILKAGVNIRGDGNRMVQYCKAPLNGMFELSNLYKLVKYSENRQYGMIDRRLVSLANQAHEILRLPLFKGLVRTSNWSKKIDKEQIMYAASDAYAGIQIFISLDERRRALRPRPPLPAAISTGEASKPIILGKGIVVNRPPRKSKSADANPDEIAADPAKENDLDGDSNNISPDLSSETLIQLANTWVEGCFAGAEVGDRVHETPRSHLRSYYLWHHEALEPATIARILKIKPTTVESYVFLAIKKTKLPHDRNRFDKLPKAFLQKTRRI